ncbi:hypothetical protein [Streptomyces sp. GbtcB6]|uniref:hypothetical protein n=1 Tax=Streptomyces sp. GbtcB6 TaxID=2824751 RepID=UPI001C30AD13|nr:hypothetical protein [Streptomyces sp. GbtcB6]
MSRVTVKCEGTIPGPPYLNGKTIEGTVDLAPDHTPTFSGTVWEMREVARDDKGRPVVVLRCEGTSHEGKDDRFLDGHTADGTVALAPDTSQPFSGTQWSLIQSDHPPFVHLMCRGTGTGDKRFLDGRTKNGTVGLIADPKPPQFTGAFWAVESA